MSRTVLYPKRFTSKRDKLNIFHYRKDRVLISRIREFNKNSVIRGHLKDDSKLKIILNSIVAKDKYDAPWFLLNLVEEAHQIFNSDNLSEQIKKIDARISALEDINHELIGMGYNALKDFKFVSTVYSMINSELFTIRDVDKKLAYEAEALMSQQKKDIEYANEFKTKRSWPRIVTYVTAISGSMGVTMAAFASELRTMVESMAGANKYALVVGTGAAVLSAVSFATGKLLDFFVNREIKGIVQNTHQSIMKLLKERDNEVSKRLAFIRLMLIKLEAQCRYLNDVKKEEPKLAVAIDKGDWNKVNKQIYSSTIKILLEKGERFPLKFMNRPSATMVENAIAEIRGLDGNPAPEIKKDINKRKK
jgi:hypothetical protein